jgi:hypothetical protein
MSYMAKNDLDQVESHIWVTYGSHGLQHNFFSDFFGMFWFFQSQTDFHFRVEFPKKSKNGKKLRSENRSWVQKSRKSLSQKSNGS